MERVGKREGNDILQLLMDTRVLNYRIIIEPELNKKTGKKVYVGFCPKPGVSDGGKTVEAAIGNIKEAIECHLESMASHKKDIPSCCFIQKT